MHDGTTSEVKARIAGGLWLAVIVTGAFGELPLRALYVANDPAATAARLFVAETQYRLAYVAFLASWACYIGVTVVLRDLLRSVSGTLASLSAFLGVTATAIGLAISVVRLVPLLLLKAPYLTGFTSAQLASLSFTALGVNRLGYLLSMVFFGLQVSTLGYLIVRSGFLPRLLGAILAVGGSTYVAGACLSFVSPQAGARVFPIVLAIAVVGEGSLGLWLLLKGITLPAAAPSPRAAH